MTGALAELKVEDIDAGALTVLRRLREAGHQAVLAGGCVRDLLLGRDPEDWDIATDARPEQVAVLFERTVSVGERFGILRVLLAGNSYEVARFRQEGPYSDGRHPDHVLPATRRQDAERRDFTINGMFYDPEGDGLIDTVDGRRDLAGGVIRAIGDPAARFAEDGLRTLRAVRFATRLDFHIETTTWSALVAKAPIIEQISGERVRDELTLILTEGGAVRGLDLLYDSGLLRLLLPEVAAMKGVDQPAEFHPEGDVWEHVKLMLGLVDALDEPAPTLAWGVLLHDIGKPATFQPPGPESSRIRFDGHDARGAEMVEEIARRLRFANRDRDRVRDLTAHHMRFRNVKQMRPSKLKRFLREGFFPELLELHRIDCQSSHGLLDLYEFCHQSLTEADEGEAEILRPPLLLTGRDLIAAGYHPGRQFGEILRWLEDEQLEGRLKTRDAALAAVRARWERPLPQA
ncbi:MAG TPA: CCA tRNA nucleotidyltransferase [Candidatus Latescibacteria bacterium]|jgi:poly(A) polymerase|nr:CCA tRNA nucleotidyltransferase [Candidatus Latescibacterota bacterium]HJP30892.1 CCA tRNA nucleotidyltransferase [Candidatus Latescibacterota bacterium]